MVEIDICTLDLSAIVDDLEDDEAYLWCDVYCRDNRQQGGDDD